MTPLPSAPDTARMHALLRRMRRSTTTLAVTLYTRQGCHLCDDAKKPVARAVVATPGATLRIVDIAGDTEREARFGLRIPVVTVVVQSTERVIAEGKISDLRLRRSLDTLEEGG